MHDTDYGPINLNVIKCYSSLNCLFKFFLFTY